MADKAADMDLLTPRGGKTESKKEKVALEKVRSELRSRVSKSLNKLCDRDTQNNAVAEFTTLCEEEPLPPSLASVVVNSLISLDTKESAFARVAVAKMFATLAGTQFAGIQPSLGKVVANLVKRTKDKDSTVRDAIGQAFGELARVLVSAGNGLPNSTSNDDTVDPDATSDSFEGGPSLGVFFKPLLQTMESAEEFSQQGCALALAHVIFSSGAAVKGHLEKLTTRIIAILGNNQFQGRKELLIAVANMVRTHPAHMIGWTGLAPWEFERRPNRTSVLCPVQRCARPRRLRGCNTHARACLLVRQQRAVRARTLDPSCPQPPRRGA